MAETVMKIEGMSCQHCVMRVRKAVSELPGVSRSEVSVGTARVEYDESKIKAAESGAGRRESRVHGGQGIGSANLD